MADGTDLPATGGDAGPSSPDSVSPVTVTVAAAVVVSVTTSAPPDTLPAPAEQAYQPLSLLAIVALLIAALYSAIVLLGGLFLMFSRTPWLLPIWTIVLPILAAGAAYIARFQIRRSEGTLSGRSVTSWAVGLSVGVGLIYCMYYLGTFFAVRWQAQAFAEKWLKTIAEGKTEEAFFETISPPRATVGSRRQTLELMYNNPPKESNPHEPSRGPFTSFSAKEYVRLLQAPGSKAKIEATGVKDWEYENGGYTVTLTYRVTTDLAMFPMQIKVHGAEGQTPETRGRQWQVVDGETGIEAQTILQFFSPEGRELISQAETAGKLATEWVGALSGSNLEVLYADTLDAKDRKAARELYWLPVSCAGILGLLAAVPEQGPYLAAGFALCRVPAVDPAGAAYLLEARRKLVSGSLLRIEDGEFWTPAELRAKVEAEAKALFDPAQIKPRHFLPQSTGLRRVTKDDKRLRLAFDLQIRVAQDDPKPALILDARILVGVDLADLPRAGKEPAVWRVEALELVRGRSAPMPRGAGRTQPGGGQ